MNNDIKVSIVVPVYNVEAYLSRCIDSLLNQSMKELQIILVDDGSEDKSGEICDRYAYQYANIEVIHHQVNHGLTSARRTGLSVCVGKYIIFVDSDDWIHSDTCKKEYEYIERCKAKLLICDFNEVNGENVTQISGFNGEKLSLSEFYKSVSPGYVWNKMYHNSLIDLMKVDIDVSQAEDIAMLIPLISKLESDRDICYLPEAFYNYYKRPDSSSNSNTFIDSYSIDEYLASLKYILMNSEKSKMQEVSFYCMNCLSWGLNSIQRRYFKADYCEFFAKELYSYVLGNSLITSRFPKLLSEIIGQSGKLIPRNLVYANFENSNSEIFQYCKNSWISKCKNYNIVELNAKNCNLQEIPECVKRAIKCNNLEFVNNYFCLDYLVKNGGIAVSKNLFIHKPLGEIRYKGIFFSYLNEKEIGSTIYGMEKGNGFGKTILETYYEEHIFNDSFLTLNKRFQFELEANWKFIPKGTSCKLMSGAINIYASNIFAILSDNNCLAELLNVEQYNAHKSGMVLMERNRFLEIINQTRENELMYSEGITEVSAKLKKHVQREEHLIKELNMYKQAYENTISSTAWKITFPLRKIMDKLKRRNRRYEGD